MIDHVSPICTVEKITHRYGQKVALRDISFQLHPGTIIGLVGANGSGKSTLLRIVAGVQEAGSGRITQFGLELSLDESAGQGVGAATDGMAMWPAWSVKKNLNYVAGLCGACRDDVLHVMDLVDISANARTSLRRLSLGNRQRVLLGAALLAGTRLVVLDEPMNGLDPDSRQRIRSLIIDLAGQGRTVVLSSHDLHDVESLCSQLLVLDEGELMFAGSTHDFVGGSQMSILRVAMDDSDRAQVLLNASAVHCRRDSSGAPVVFTHDLSAATRLLEKSGIHVSAVHQRNATLEEKYHDRI